MSRQFVFTLGCLAATLLIATSATATERGTATIEPWDRVHGMLVVQGTATEAGGSLFGLYCRPAIVHPGRYRRTCSEIPRVERLFVGYGLFATPATISSVWSATRWSMWIDGERVRLDAFGASDRTLYHYPPADGRDVTLREWNVVLVRPRPGLHTIRYRLRHAQGTIDATWEFRVVQL